MKNLFQKRILLPYILFLTCAICRSQPDKTDSLRQVIKSVAEDTNKVNALNRLAWSFRDVNDDTAALLSKQALSLAEKLKFSAGIAGSNDILGTLSKNNADFRAALAYYTKSLQVWEKLPAAYGWRKSVTLNNMGTVVKSMGNYPLAIRYYLMALRFDEQTGNKKGIGKEYGCLGNVYKGLGDYRKASEYYFKALDISREMGNKRDESIWLGNISSLYVNQFNYVKGLSKDSANRLLDEALKYGGMAMSIDSALKDLKSIPYGLAGMANIFYFKSDIKSALKYYERALTIAIESGDRLTASQTYGNMANIYIDTKKFSLAAKTLDEALRLAHETGALEFQLDQEFTYYNLDSLRGNYKGALEHYKNFIATLDSITNENNIKKQTELEMQFEFDKKQSADSIRIAEEKKVARAELRAEKNKSYMLYGGLVLVIFLAGLMYNRFHLTQKQKRIIEKQKCLVEEQKQVVEHKNRDILDSIRYAERIQRSLLPPEKYLTRYLKN